jgi:hypothetical protein
MVRSSGECGPTVTTKRPGHHSPLVELKAQERACRGSPARPRGLPVIYPAGDGVFRFVTGFFGLPLTFSPGGQAACFR